MPHKLDQVSRFFDFIFASGFTFLAVMFIVQMITHDTGINPEYIVLEGYYIFFALFMLAASLRVEILMVNCGFLKSILPKSIFYAFLASMAFGDVAFWSCDVTGSVFAILVVLNFLRYCGDGEEPEYEKVAADAPAAAAATA